MKIVKNISIVLLVMTLFMTLPIRAISNNDTTDNVSNVTAITYRSFVDQDYGFYSVLDITTLKKAPYDINDTLTIHVGDTVVWINDATPDEPLTIISKDNLWGNESAYLRWNYQKFNYTFNQSGIYDIYIKEYPRIKHQTVVVKDTIETIKIVPTPTITLTVNPTVNETENITSNASANKSNKSITKTNFPIEVIMAIVGIIILVIYISRKK
jgi:plastocyanin